MDVNSVYSATATYAAYESAEVKKSAKTEEAKDSAAVKEEPAAVYEKSGETEQAKTYKTDTKTVQQMLADSEQKVQAFKQMIQKMFGKQAETSSLADGIWQKLAKGDFTVDAATKAQAQADVSEDGYWGVKQTSGRILDFAKALTGGDPEKMDKMKAAFEKGYKQAEKAWGGELPEISKQTYDAVLKGFEDFKTELQG